MTHDCGTGRLSYGGYVECKRNVCESSRGVQLYRLRQPRAEGGGRAAGSAVSTRALRWDARRSLQGYPSLGRRAVTCFGDATHVCKFDLGRFSLEDYISFNYLKTVWDGYRCRRQGLMIVASTSTEASQGDFADQASPAMIQPSLNRSGSC